MLNYIRAECYKLLHRKYIFGFTFAILACEVLLVAGWIFTNANGNHVDFYTGGLMAVTLLNLGLYFLIIVADMVFSDQYKYNTLKNEVSFGLPRARIYLGKLIVEALVGMILAVIFLAFYEALCYLTLLPGEPDSARLVFVIVGYCFLTALPQWLGVLAVANMLYFLVRSNVASSFAMVGILVVPPFVLNILCAVTYFDGAMGAVFETLLSWMPTELVSGASSQVGNWAYLGKSWLLGLVWFAVSTAVGLTLFRKKEIT